MNRLVNFIITEQISVLKVGHFIFVNNSKETHKKHTFIFFIVNHYLNYSLAVILETNLYDNNH